MLNELFGPGDPLDWPQVVLPRLIERFRATLKSLQQDSRGNDALYVRLCTAFRRMDLDPPPRAFWDAACQGTAGAKGLSLDLTPLLNQPLDEEGRNRLILLIESMGEPAVGEILRQRCLERDAGFVAAQLLVMFARWADGLTAELLRSAPFRLEELARKWVCAIGGRIEGESATESNHRLRDLDFSGAFAALEKAREDRRSRPS